MRPEAGISAVSWLRLSSGTSQRRKSIATTKLMETAFSMIVEMTSWMPRVTFSTPAMTAHSDPVAMPTRMMTVRCSGAGRDNSAATCAAMMEARMY